MESREIEINPVYHKYLYNSQDYRYVFLFGSANSGKSYEATTYFSAKVNNDTTFTGLVIRKTYSTIKDTIYDSIKKKFRLLNIEDSYNFNTRPCEIYCKETAYDNNKVLFKGAQDVEKIKSLNDIDTILIEEGSELEENDFLQIDIRMRGSGLSRKQIVLMFNPVSINHWLLKYVEPQLMEEEDRPSDIKEINILEHCEITDQPLAWEIVSEVEGKDNEIMSLKTLVLNTNINHNLFATSEDHAQLNKLAGISDVHYQVYKKGRWGEVNDGDLFVPSFSRSKHVKDVPYLEEFPIHYTCDFNTKPYMTGILCQYIQHREYDEIRVFKEYALSYPNNHSFALGETFNAEYEDDIHNNGAFIYGDASGNNKLGIKSVTSLFSDLKAGLGYVTRRCKFRVPPSNPRYGNEMSKNFLARRLLLDKIFIGEMVNGRKVKITIDKSCKNLIGDLENCKQDANGRLEKKKKNGIEERGHMIDAFTYFTHHHKILGKHRKLR